MLFADVKTTRGMLGNENADIKKFIANGQNALAEGHVEGAFENFHQVVSLSMQIYGPVSIEIAHSLRRLANLHSKFMEFLQAIEMQTKSIVLTERLLGPDHPEVAESY